MPRTSQARRRAARLAEYEARIRLARARIALDAEPTWAARGEHARAVVAHWDALRALESGVAS